MRARFFFMLYLCILPLGQGYARAADIMAFSERVLLQSLSLNYQTVQEQLKTVSYYYTPAAWQSLNGFLDEKITYIQDNQLILHPTVIKKPELTQEGTISGVHYSSIRQNFNIPELKLILETVVVVIGNDINTLKIQSVNMIQLPNMPSEF